MNFRLSLIPILFSALSIGVSAQCSSSDLKPIWDSAKSQFRCVDPKHPDVAVKDDSVQPTGDKEFCGSIRDKLQAMCPEANEGKACRSQAKSIYNACTKREKSDTAGSSGAASPAGKTDAATCMSTFQQQQQACAARRLPPPAPGAPNPPDTCLQDAMAAERACLAKSN